MHENDTPAERTGSASAQDTLSGLWEEHVNHEFATRDTESTLATMVEDAYVNHIPVLTGGVGQDELREFYSRRFIPADASRYRADPDLPYHRGRPACG